MKARPPEVESALRAAITRAGSGDREGARAAIDRVIAEDVQDATSWIVAGLVAYVIGDYDRSLGLLYEARARGAGPRVYWLIQERAFRLGWDLDARDALVAGAREEPEDPRWEARLFVHATLRESDVTAAALGVRVVARTPNAPGLRLELAGVLARRGDHDRASEHVEQALATSSALPLRLEAGRIMRRIGRFARARTIFRDALVDAPGEPFALASLAELALWSGEHEEAAAYARALEASCPSAPARRVLGACAHLEGDRRGARSRFESALAIDPRDSEAHAFLAEIALRDGRFEDAHAHLSSAVAAGSGDVLAASVLRLRINAEERTKGPFRPAPVLAEPLRPCLRVLCPELAHVLGGDDAQGWRDVLDLALARMHGNRSTTPTYLADRELRPVPRIADPRRESRLVLNRIRIDAPEGLLRELDALAERFTWSGLPLAHKGELLLWLGRIDEAERALRGAIATLTHTRWAYIGLAAAALVRRAPKEALRVLAQGVRVMNDTTGPAVYVHRAEALLQLGRLEEAEHDLARARVANPNRLATVILTARLQLARGDRARVRETFAEIRRRAPGLCADALRELDVRPLALEDASIEVWTEIIEHVLHMLRGCRSSSWTTYVTREGRMRFCQLGGPDPHERDAHDLAFAVQVLERGVAALPRIGRASPKAST